jgi:GNAT superfamily N-acetyltransferase
VNELERVEAQAMRDAVTLGGGRAGMAGGAMCLQHPGAPAPELNRALPVGAHVDVGEIAAWFAGHAHVVSVPPGYLGLEDALRRHGYAPGHAWMKFRRDDRPSEPVPTDLGVEESLDSDAFAVAFAEGFGIPSEVAAGLCGFVGAPGWHSFVAWAGDEPAAAAALYSDGEQAWLGIAATRPAFRRRGAQRALIAARIECARRLGARRLSTETGERVPSGPDQSYRNILRGGFHEAYLRPNWRSGGA